MAQKTENLIKTPGKNIPIGVPTRLRSGEPALQVKRPGEEVYDIISLESLVRQILAMSTQTASTTVK